MVKQQLVSTLKSYLPALLLKKLTAENTNLNRCSEEHLYAVVFFADISGFTYLTDQLAEKGPRGAEELSSILNYYFGRMIDVIHEYGGDVVKFAGDSLLALWTSDNPEELRTSVFHASKCALRVQANLLDYRENDTYLGLKIGISAGKIQLSSLGGVFGRWEFIISGEPLVAVGEAEKCANPGEVVLSPSAWDIIIRPKCKGELLENGFFNLKEVKFPFPAIPTKIPPIDEKDERLLWSYIPAAIRSHITAGQIGWVAELRVVTIVFINLPDLTYYSLPERKQEIVSTLQSLIYKYEGSVNKLSIDEKGVAFIAAFGLPPLAHEDDAVRGVQAALEIQAVLKNKGIKSSFGITSGKVFCGSIGNFSRREYTMIGDIVNLSSRLMQASSGKIFCDENTYEAARVSIRFSELYPIVVKGKSDPVNIYQPYEKVNLKIKVGSHKHKMIGRQKEKQQILLELKKLSAIFTSKGYITNKVYLLQGEAGIGKSSLLMDLMEDVLPLNYRILISNGDAIEKENPYYIIKPLLSHVLGLNSITENKEEQKKYLETLFKGKNNIIENLPLLNPVLALDFPETKFTSLMKGKIRSDNTNEIISEIFKSFSGTRLNLIIVDDFQWTDSASCTTIKNIISETKNSVVILGMRPAGDSGSEGTASLINAPEIKKIELKNLSPAETNELIAAYLKVPYVPESITETIFRKTEGHPLFVMELINALLEENIIFSGDDGFIFKEIFDPAVLTIPNSLNGVIVSRIDRLTPQQQLVLKIASVIGYSFRFETLFEIYPLDEARRKLVVTLNELIRLKLIDYDLSNDRSYKFKHPVIMEVVYDLMLYSQKKDIHRMVAEWFEIKYENNLKPYYTILARHWKMAEIKEKALFYLNLSGKISLGENANREAIYAFTEALKMEDFSDSSRSRLERARKFRYIGEAYFNMGLFRESVENFRTSLAILGTNLPEKEQPLKLNIFLELIKYFRPKLFEKKFSMSKSKLIIEKLQSFEFLRMIGFFSNQKFLSLYAALYALNLAEAIKTPPELARAYSSMATISSVIPVFPLAQYFRNKALTFLKMVNDTHSTAYVYSRICFYSVVTGNLEIAKQEIEISLNITRKLGDKRRYEEDLYLLSLSNYFSGELLNSLKLYNKIYLSAKKRNYAHLYLLAILGKAEAYIALKKNSLALKLLKEAMNGLKHYDSGVEELRVYGLLAVVYFENSNYPKARENIDRFIAMALKTDVSLPALNTIIWFSVMLFEFETRQTENREKIKNNLAIITGLIEKYSKAIPLGSPYTLLFKGLYHYRCEHNPEKGKTFILQGLKKAVDLNNPYAKAMLTCYYALLFPGDKTFQEQINESVKILHGMKERYFADKLESIIETTF